MVQQVNTNTKKRNLKNYTKLKNSLLRMASLIRMSLLFTLALSMAQQTLFGQCTPLCITAPDAPLVLEDITDCEVTLTPALFLSNSGDCTGTIQIQVNDGASNMIGQADDMLSLDVSNHLNEVLSVTLTDLASGAFCVGYMQAVDNTAPIVQCQNVTISCFADTSVSVIGQPIITDNCDTEVAISYQDFFIDADCNLPSAAVVTRVWSAIDNFGNITTCSQNIFINRPDLGNVLFPSDVTQDCSVANTEPASAGEPLLDGILIENGTICDVVVGKTDQTIPICGAGSYEISRTWTVMDQCTGFMVSAVQTISVVDNTEPQITCPDDMTVNTLSGQCTAAVTLPEPTVLDDCGDGQVGFAISTSYGAVGQGPHPDVPVGTHTIQYAAFDECGNTSDCNITLTVLDEEEPVAVCENFTIISIPTPGQAMVMAETFDDGSHDNCGDNPVFFKARRMTVGACDDVNGDDSPNPGIQEWFDDYVIFCCDEADGDNVMVQFRVYEINPGDGPVDPARELPGGDLFGHFTECMVEVQIQDKIDPIIVCPNNQVIDCSSDISDLSIFGTVHGGDNCSFTLDSIEVVDRDNCGIGSVTRTFIATDPSGNSSACTQTITLINETPLDETGIAWPLDFTTDQCDGDLEPINLPAGYNEPSIIDESCTMVGISREDVTFDMADPACFKILRTWRVLDWCNYDPMEPANGGLFSHIQILKVEDNTPPTLSCPEDLVVPVGADCQNANVTIPVPTFEDCNPNVTIEHNSPYAFAQGEDASGIYPLGTTVITFVANDECGNTTSCTVSVTVEDQTPPSPLCIVGLSISLTNMDGVAMAIVDASAFDGGSFDNCTDGGQLKRTIRRATAALDPAPETTSLTFTCADLGTQMIEFWVVDALGNSDYCLTYVVIQDNNSLCDDMNSIPTGVISGVIATEEGDEVEGVTVSINSANAYNGLFEGDGFFEFPTVPVGLDYTVEPSKNLDPMNGVTTLDLVLISKHILGVQSLDSPYKMIAADVDRSGNLNTLDLIKLRKLILNMTVELPNGNRSWRFVDADFEFENVIDPFREHIPEVKYIESFGGNMADANFVAIKVGDVNYTAVVNSSDEVEERSEGEGFQITVKDTVLEQGEETTVTFYADELDNLLAYQFTLGYDPAKIEVMDLETGSLPNLTEANFGTMALPDGLITTSWNKRSEKEVLADGANLFHLQIRAKAATQLKDVFYITSKMTKAEAYELDGQPMNVKLVYEGKETLISQEQGLILHQNRPNPFAKSTTIGFELPDASPVTLTVFNTDGQVILAKQQLLEPGYHEILLNANELNTSGILYYRLDTNKYSATRKMVILE